MVARGEREDAEEPLHNLRRFVFGPPLLAKDGRWAHNLKTVECSQKRQTLPVRSTIQVFYPRGVLG